MRYDGKNCKKKKDKCVVLRSSLGGPQKVVGISIPPNNNDLFAYLHRGAVTVGVSYH